MDEKKGKDPFSGVNEVVKQKYLFGKYEEKEMLTKLKFLALNHDKPGITPNSIRPLWDQTLRVREVMALTNYPLVRSCNYFSYLLLRYFFLYMLLH